MVHLIKCLGKIKVHCVHIDASFQETDDIVVVGEQLTEARSTGTKAMLICIECIIFVQETDKVIPNNLLKHFDDM